MKKGIMILLLLLMMLAGCSQSKTPEYETINLDQIQSKVEEGYIVVDVREIEEYNSAHILGAINKPLSDLKKDDVLGLNINENYVIICESGNRSKEASKLLSDYGYHVVNVSEGMSTWTGEIE